VTTATRPAFPEPPKPGDELPRHYSGCFACGELEGGLRMRFTAGENETMWAVFEVSIHHQGAPGIAHGGLIAAAMDEALGTLAHYTRRPAVTGQLSTTFRRPVPVGATLHIVARIDSREGRKVNVSATAHLDAREGPVAAEATAVFITVPLAHFTEHGRAAEVAAAEGEMSARRAVQQG
jgi:acyl-coenzyme A thioesterase PaaI-like protein